MSTLTLEPQAVPLRADDCGVLRVGNTRVSFDSVVYAFNDGATPEEIVQDFDTLDLATAYTVIGYYLKHKNEVAKYLECQEQEAEKIRSEWAARWPDHAAYRQLLLARLAAKELQHAPPG